ncbi:zinc finger protein [Reticulomyxa filosa]|uniref:Zinc finger protein n=1 Tax=Reticulomyxa filosa TaxID=46433 RepID=X6NK56_RETFI|nr:zinc finger protein [Reticulomyxa filosa]|eukprot:ETO25742.1 zinc finger protein [Reticulomyxa filosa]
MNLLCQEDIKTPNENKPSNNPSNREDGHWYKRLLITNEKKDQVKNDNADDRDDNNNNNNNNNNSDNDDDNDDDGDDTNSHKAYFCEINDEFSQDCFIIGGNDDYVACRKQVKSQQYNTFFPFSNRRVLYQNVYVKQLSKQNTDELSDMSLQHALPSQKNFFELKTKYPKKDSHFYQVRLAKAFENFRLQSPRTPSSRHPSAGSNPSDPNHKHTPTNDAAEPSVSAPHLLLDLQDSSWGFIIDGLVSVYKKDFFFFFLSDTMAYVLSSNANIIRVIQWNGDNGPDNHNAKIVNTCDNGKRSFILTMDYRDGILVALSSDHKISVFLHGRKIAVATNIPGTFVPGYAYIVKRSWNALNLVYYTADEGIFVVEF